MSDFKPRFQSTAQPEKPLQVRLPKPFERVVIPAKWCSRTAIADAKREGRLE